MKQTQQTFSSACSIFLTHGAGPFPILKKELHKGMYDQLQNLVKKYPNPKALVIFSAHWEEAEWTILDHDKPSLLYDYYGFPSEAYKIQYPAESTVELRKYVQDSLMKQGYKLKKNTKRGYDHGVFIPLSIMYPKANIPVIQISILSSLDPESHFKMGKALIELKKEGFMIIGSGSSVHGGFGQENSIQKSKEFNQDLSRLSLSEFNEQSIQKKIQNWKQLRHANLFHPREEHLVPYFVNIGAYEGMTCEEQRYQDPFMQLHISNFIFD